MSSTDQSVTLRASRALGWSFANTIASRLGTLGIGIVLARVLGPEEFGIFAIAMIALLATLSFNELGVSLAVIRWRDAPATIAPTINTIAVASSALITGAVLITAPAISSLLGDPRATPVVRLIALSILINGLVATPAAVLQREFMQKHRTIADQVSTWLGAIVSLGLALTGWGAMSLAVGRLLGSVVSAVLLIRWSPVPYRFGWSPDIVGRLVRFGLPLAAASVVVFLAGYADQAVVGSLAGVEALGFYVLAFNLASWPVAILSLPLRAVAPAMFSALKGNPDEMARTFNRTLTILACVAIPACMGLSAAAEPIVVFVYGMQWRPAAWILAWLAAFAALKILFELAYDYLVVHGKSGVLLLIQSSLVGTALPLMLIVVSRYGAHGVAGVQFAVGVLVAIPLYVVALGRVGVAGRSLGGALVLPAAGGAVAWLGCSVLAHAIDPAVLAACVAGVCTVLIAAALVWRNRELLTSWKAPVLGQEGT